MVGRLEVEFDEDYESYMAKEEDEDVEEEDYSDLFPSEDEE